MAGQLGALGAPVRIRLRAIRTRAGQWVATSSYLRKWLVLGIAIGVIAGLGAVTFYSALSAATWLLLHVLAGYDVPRAVGEGIGHASHSFARPWAVPLVVGLGGLASGLLVFRFAPDAEGHGTDAAIHAVHENPRGIRVRTVVVKMIASALTIGSGGSGGREGPTAQISAGFSSLMARVLNLSPTDGRIAVAVGIGSGIGAIFKAPLGATVLAAEILYRDDMEVETLLPAIIASIVSYTLFGAFEGFTPLFGDLPRYHIGDPFGLAWFAVIGVAAGALGLLYAKGFYGIADLFTRLPVSRYLKPAIGGFGVGLIALGVPEVMGTGYGWVQQAFGRASLLHLSLAIVVVLPLPRTVATGLSIGSGGSGGSGGIFGPGIVIGAFLGAAAWRLLEPVAPGVPHDPTVFVVVGMMACFGSISRAPIGVMLMVAEMTASVETLAPAMIAVGLATLIVRRSDDSIYRSQVRTRSDSPAHRLQFGMPLLANVAVSEVMSSPQLLLEASEPVAEALERLSERGLPGGPVVDGRGVFLGTVSADTLAQGAAGSGKTLDRVLDVTAPSIQANAALDVALEALSNAAGSWVTVLDSGQHVVGIFNTSALVAGYRRALISNTARLSKLAGNAVPVEIVVGDHAPAAHRAVRDAGLPPGTIVVTVQRDGTLLFAEADTVLEPGDLISALVRARFVDAFRSVIDPGDGTTTSENDGWSSTPKTTTA
jgi:CIC family chloride channel protein